VIWDPWLTKAKQEGKGWILASSKEFPNLIVDCVAFNNDVVSRNPQDVQSIVNAVFKAIAYWKNQPADANRIMAPHFQVDAAKYADILTGLNFTGLERNRRYFGTVSAPGPIFSVAERASQLWMEAGAISQPVNAQSIISTKFVSEGQE
jgi:NitT/TauT family transport system substrate-binding protein